MQSGDRLCWIKVLKLSGRQKKKGKIRKWIKQESSWWRTISCIASLSATCWHGKDSVPCRLTTPLGRSCTGEELGATGVFLASDGAAAITGQVIYVDGGYQIMGM